MKKRLAELIHHYGATDLVKDAHVYGGTLLVAAALGTLWWPATPLTIGIVLLYIGLWR